MLIDFYDFRWLENSISGFGWIAIWSYDMIMLYLGLTQKIEQSPAPEKL